MLNKVGKNAHHLIRAPEINLKTLPCHLVHSSSMLTACSLFPVWQTAEPFWVPFFLSLSLCFFKQVFTFPITLIFFFLPIMSWIINLIKIYLIGPARSVFPLYRWENWNWKAKSYSDRREEQTQAWSLLSLPLWAGIQNQGLREVMGEGEGLDQSCCVLPRIWIFSVITEST